MREIKFRAWDKYLKKWLLCPVGVYFREGKLWGFIPGLRDEEKECWLSPDRYEFVQFTGLKDKNGKEIYEGDIVKSYVYVEPFVSQVTFEYGQFTVDCCNERCAEAMKKSEIIGNIYENPEIIKFPL